MTWQLDLNNADLPDLNQSLFGKDRIVNVFADREFIGEKWFTWLIENDINFCIRVKKTLL